jgi:hypothetical protein
VELHAALLRFVRLSSELASQAVRQDFSFAEKQEPAPALLGRRAFRGVPRVGGADGLRSILAELGLELKPAKTRIVYLREGGEGLDFLGFDHRRVRGERGRTCVPRPLALTRGNATSPRSDP